MTFTTLSDAIKINGDVNVSIKGDTLNTKIEYSPDGEVTWFPLQAEIGTDTVITVTGCFNLQLPAGNIRFNGGTNVTVFVATL
jgi:hypothetical protein